MDQREAFSDASCQLWGGGMTNKAEFSSRDVTDNDVSLIECPLYVRHDITLFI